VAVATARCARSTRHGQWMERKTDPGPLAPKAVPGGPAASSTCWCVFMTMRHSAYLFAVVAVRSSCQDHVANDIEPMTAATADQLAQLQDTVRICDIEQIPHRSCD
jgi:hypothetical protein